MNGREADHHSYGVEQAKFARKVILQRRARAKALDDFRLAFRRRGECRFEQDVEQELLAAQKIRRPESR
jgi:hypothetical protein